LKSAKRKGGFQNKTRRRKGGRGETTSNPRKVAEKGRTRGAILLSFLEKIGSTK